MNTCILKPTTCVYQMHKTSPISPYQPSVSPSSTWNSHVPTRNLMQENNSPFSKLGRGALWTKLNIITFSSNTYMIFYHNNHNHYNNNPRRRIRSRSTNPKRKTKTKRSTKTKTKTKRNPKTNPKPKPKKPKKF